MSFDWLHYLNLALELSDQAASSKHRDAKLRSSISRAYYATFHKSRQLLNHKWGISIPKGPNAHKQVQNEFKRRKQYGIQENLYRMRGYRNKADYDDEFADLEGTARENIWRAKQVLSCLRCL
jgi:uncharacterized protein (UPF0332 family)